MKLTTQSIQILRRLAEMGIWGVNAEEVAARLVDQKLQEFWLEGKIRRKSI